MADAMADTPAIPCEPWSDFRTALLDDGVLLATDVDGDLRAVGHLRVGGRRHRPMVLRVGADQDALSVRFPPVMPWSNFVQNGYLESFPDQMGSIHTFRGDEQAPRRARARRRGGGGPCAAARVDRHGAVPGRLPPAVPDPGRDAARRRATSSRSTATASATSRAPTRSACRPSASTTTSTSARPTAPGPTGTAGSSAASRCSASLGLAVESVVANDPFFGRPGRMLAANQRNEELKYEIVAPVFAEGRPTAISSSNCHLDHFSRPFGIDDGRRWDWPTPPASGSASTGSPSPCSTATAPTPTAGPPVCGPCCGPRTAPAHGRPATP